MPNCRDCGSEVQWVRFVKKNGDEIKYPLDAEPDPLGKMEIVDGYAKYYGTTNATDKVLFTCHWDSCKDKQKAKLTDVAKKVNGDDDMPF